MVWYSAIEEKLRVRFWRSAISRGAKAPSSMPAPGASTWMRTSLSPPPYGSDCRMTPWTTEKIAVFAPIPRASVRTAAAA